jgi:glutathione S-transferase
MRLYDFALAPSPRKVRLFMAEKGLEIPVVSVNLRALEQRDASFTAKNPDATVPVLELDDGSYLTESLAICHYLEALFPEPNLFGYDSAERAAVLMWNDIATMQGYLALQEVLRNEHEAFKDRALPGPVPYEQIPLLAARGRRRAAVFFDRLEQRLAASHFVASTRFTYADIAAYVYTGFAKRALREDPTQGRPMLARWAAIISARPAFVERADQAG